MGWIRKQLDARRVKRVVAALKRHRRFEAVAACIRTCEANMDRMRCDLYRRRELPVGSGIVKAPASASSEAGSKDPGAVGRRREPTPCSPPDAASKTGACRLPRLEGLQRRSSLTQENGMHPASLASSNCRALCSA